MSELPARVVPADAPVRTAEQQFAAAGADSCAVCILPNGHVLVGGKGGDTLMELTQWNSYVLMARRWLATPVDRQEAVVEFVRPAPRTETERAFASLDRLIRAGQIAVDQGDLQELEDILQKLGQETSALAAKVSAAEKGGRL